MNENNYFIRFLENNKESMKEEIAEIRNTYKKEIPNDDIVTPIIIYQLRREKKKLDKKWGENGKISVEKAFSNKEDASAHLYYESGKLTASVYKVFKDGIGRRNSHRAENSMLPGLAIHARIPHAYTMGEELSANASKDRSHWEISMWNEYTGKSTIKYRTKNFCNLRTLEKTLIKIENELKPKTHVDKT